MILNASQHYPQEEMAMKSHPVVALSVRLSVSLCVIASTGLVMGAGAAVPPNYTSLAWFDSATAVSRQVATAESLGMPLRDTIMLPGNVPLVMVVVPAGRFVMGSPASEPGSEGDESQHNWTIPQPYYISETAITQAQYSAVIGADSMPSGTTEWGPTYTARMYFGYCRKVYCPHVQAYAPRDWQFAMVTQAQMEYATRAGMGTQWFSGTGTDQASFDASVWWSGNSGDREQPVGLKNPNHWGLHDMLGNVWTFVDFYCSSGYTQLTNWTKPNDSINAPNVVKGGSYNSESLGNGCRCANHQWMGNGQALRLVMNCTRDLMNPTPVSPARVQLVPQCKGISVAGDRIIISQTSVGLIEFISLDGEKIPAMVEIGLQQSQTIRFRDVGLTPGTYLMRVRTADNSSAVKIQVR
jgi:formylglycine-generating enzyme required for sulfatase activity